MGTALRPPAERTPGELLLITLPSDAVLVLAVLWLGRTFIGLHPSELGLRRPRPAALSYAAFAAAGLWIVSVLINAAWISLFGANPQSLIVSVGAHRGLAALALDLTTGSIVAPFAEEMLFRGLIFGGLAQRLPFPVAASASGLLFATAHGLAVVAPIFVLGVGLAYIYRRTGTLWSSVLAHGLVNAISLLLVFAGAGA